MRTEFEQETEKSTDEIRSDIAKTRQALDETLDRLGQVLHPRRLGDELLGIFSGRNKEGRNTLADAGSSFFQGIANRPVSTMIIASGLVALLIEQKRAGQQEPSDYSYTRWSGEPFGPGPYYEQAEGKEGEEARSTAQNVMESARGGVQEAKDKVTELGESAKESVMRGKARISGRFHRAGEQAGAMSGKAASYGKKLGREAQETYSEGLHRLQETAGDYPLAAGAASFAVGLLCGLGLPISRKEQELMGPAAEEIKAKAGATVEELKERGAQAAEGVAQEVKSQAEEIKPEQQH